jgi:hypothetical protein
MIEGAAGGVTLDANGDNPVFTITSCKSCMIRNITIDATDITGNETPCIFIDESSNNPVFIDNVTINLDEHVGHAIRSYSDNVVIEHCRLSRGRVGIYNIGTNNIITKNQIEHTESTDSQAFGIFNQGASCRITGNVINDVKCGDDIDPYWEGYAFGIRSEGDSCRITGNEIDDIKGGDNTGVKGGYAFGIYIIGARCIFSSNIMKNISGGNSTNANAGDGHGAYITSTGTKCIFSSNIMKNINGGNNTGSGNGGSAYGFIIVGGSSNTCIGNTVQDVSKGSGGGGADYGFYESASSDHDIFIGNNVHSEAFSVNGTGSVNVGNV